MQNNNQQKPVVQPKIKLSDTKPVLDETGQPLILTEGSILRKGNRFLLGMDTDPLIPIPVMYNIKTNKILLDMIPAELRSEYEDVGFYISEYTP